MENLKSSSFLLTSTEESVEGEPGTLRIQVCTRCIIGAGFCSLQQFVSNEIIFADVATYSRYIIQRQSQACKCTHIPEGDPSLDCVHPTKAKIFRQLVWSGFYSNKQWPFQKASPWTGKSAILGRDLPSQTSWGWRGCDRVFALKSEQAGRGFGSFPWEQSPHVICASRNTRESKKFKTHVAHSTHVVTERDRPRG